MPPLSTATNNRWYKNAGRLVLPLTYSATVVDAITQFKEADTAMYGALNRRELLVLTRELGWDDADCWRMSQLMGDTRGAVSLQAFVAMYNDRQLANELMRVYDRDQTGAVRNPADDRLL